MPNDADLTKLIGRFYTAFQTLDADGMIACYHADVVFSDPVFPELKGPRAGAMWKMLAARAKGFELTFDRARAEGSSGTAHWEAKYLFSATGRQVHNIIDARFDFRDGKIIRHVDTFDLWRWAGMALGAKGRLLGWAPPVQNKIRSQAAAGLDQFVASQKSG